MFTIKTNTRKVISLILLSVISITLNTAFAVVPVINPTDIAKDTTTMTQYVTQVGQTVEKIGASYNVTEQVKNLQGLQKLQAGAALCQLCTQSDQRALAQYANNINDDLCSQISTAYQTITGVANAAKSLQDVIKLVATNPQAAGLALQQAAISAQTSTNNTLAQMQLMQAQSVQKQLAQEKLNKINNDKLTSSFGHGYVPKNPGAE
jgi:hypothetical protein